MLTNKKTCELAVHFNCIEHDISEISFIVIEKITSRGDAAYIDRLLLTREAYWTAQLYMYIYRFVELDYLFLLRVSCSFRSNHKAIFMSLYYYIYIYM